MAVDATKRPLTINPRFIPYLEKHRIYELLYDITTNLAIRKPKDHILFIRNFLKEVNETRDKPRIIVFTPPHIDGANLAQFISDETRAKLINLEDLLEESEEDILPVCLALRLERLIQKEEMAKTGWILNDFPRDYSEAKVMQKHGIFPTHTFEICSSPELYSLNDAWFSNVRMWPLDKFKKAMTVHKRKMFGLKKAFQSTFKRVPVNARTLMELAKECVEITKMPVYKGAPMIPRVVLIGTRGSRRRTVARGLKEKFSMVHIDMEELIIQGLKSETEMGEELRRLQRSQSRIYARTILTFLQKRLLQHDCLKNGWVLTGIHRDIEDLRILDTFETPPNKMIFLSVEASKAFTRLKNRRINAYTGDLKSVQEIRNDPTDDIKEYIIHPRDHEVNVKSEQKSFEKHVQNMLDYCGENCYIVNADGSNEEVIERVSKIVMEPGLIAPPRCPVMKPGEQKISVQNTNFIIPSRSCSVIYPRIMGKIEQIIEKGFCKND